eukprot:gnl/MRDRNA2_/MRDRNA2_27371_c0_seq1.p1 gnl/MRDRNA2_/MRDRNA2_27371_c0~~gnl/MRDRNA2_/MRDRNA2_27371_c0_seq1.p1  ORF type:complete len:443 (+),score=93.02 gnl/MRDRNA2_/MRDRNA2_27371_c0_seq1:71-1399(+)
MQTFSQVVDCGFSIPASFFYLHCNAGAHANSSSGEVNVLAAKEMDGQFSSERPADSLASKGIDVQISASKQAEKVAAKDQVLSNGHFLLPQESEKSKACWSKYESIESVDNSRILLLVRAMDATNGGASNLKWIATEKVHGANFSFETDGELVEYASRVQKIGENADFYNARSTMPKYHPFVLEAFRLAQELWPDIQRVVIYGEYFGGYYPGHKTPGLKKVQGGVAYSPDHHFYAFDMFCDKIGFLDFDECRKILISAGFPLVMAPLMCGTLDEVLAFDVEGLRTTIPAQLGHSLIHGFQIAEGIVIRPACESQAIAGKRAILKKKARAFWEATNQHGILAKKSADDQCLAGSEGTAIAIVRGLITINRLRAVISKDPDLLKPENAPKLNGMFTKDVLQDYANLHGEVTLDKKELAIVKKAAHYMSVRFVEDHIKGIRDDVG